MPWACFQTYGAQERKALTNLARQGLTAFCPFYLKPTLPKRGKILKPRELPLFPCYGFVRLDDPAQYGTPSNTYGVIRLLTDRNRLNPAPLWVPEDYIDNLARVSTPAGNHALFPLNTIVRVKKRDSPFFDLEGTVVALSRADRIKLLMNLFSRDVVIEFDLGDIEEAK